MNIKKMIVLATIVLALFMIVPTTQAKAECYHCNPLLLPFAVLGAAVGTAAAIATAPFRPLFGPYYYSAAPPPPPVYYRPRYYRHRVWMRGYHTPYGAWVPGHWSYR